MNVVTTNARMPQDVTGDYLLIEKVNSGTTIQRLGPEDASDVQRPADNTRATATAAAFACFILLVAAARHTWGE